MKRKSTSASPTQVVVFGSLHPKIYQFVITLIGIIPRIWRRIQVPSDFGFYAFHSAIQDVFGWVGISVYSFEMFSSRPEVESVGLSLHDGVPSYDHDTLITDYFTSGGHSASYVYDEQWRFHIELEKIGDKLIGVGYPMCLDGERCCPREGTTSARDYKLRLNIAADPGHPMHSRSIDDLATMGHSQHFNPQTVDFKNPIERFQLTYN